MGERALAVVRSGNGDDIYHSPWAGRRATRVLGAPHSDRYAILAECNWQYRTHRSPSSVLRHVDTHSTGAVYLVSTDGVTVFRPVWTGFGPLDDPDTGSAGDGLLVHTATVEEFRRLRTTSQFLRIVLQEALRLGFLDRDQARDVLTLAVRTSCPPERIQTPGTSLGR